MKKIYVFLDNGHGCNTKGKCSPDKSILEYKWCREIVYMIYNELIKLGIPTFIVTPEQSDISLNERVRRINKEYTNRKRQGYQCILLSIPINASGNDGVDGFQKILLKIQKEWPNYYMMKLKVLD